jgi:hypothetical protein
MDEDAWSLVIENIYKITRCREDYINPTTDRDLSWRSFKSYDIDLRIPWIGGRISYMKCQQGDVCISLVEEHMDEIGSYRMMDQIQ